MSRTARRLARTGIVAIVSLLFAAGCRDIVDMLRLSAAVKKEFGHQPRVELFNRRHLIVRFEDSPLAGRPDEAKLARRVAEFVRDRYPKYRKLDDVAVVFQRGRTGYTFTRADLGEPRR